MAARIRKGDTVYVISGKDKGKTGTVLKVIVETDKVVVEGLNKVTKHQTPTQRKPQGERVQREAPMAACKVMPVDPTTGKPTRVRHKTDDDGTKIRVAAKSGAKL